MPLSRRWNAMLLGNFRNLGFITPVWGSNLWLEMDFATFTLNHGPWRMYFFDSKCISASELTESNEIQWIQSGKFSLENPEITLII